MQRLSLPLSLVLSALALATPGCGSSGSGSLVDGGGGSSASGSGASGGDGGTLSFGGTSGSGATAGSGGSSAAGCGQTLDGTIRDFNDTHPDFEYVIGDDLGIVTSTLGPDGKPVYAGNPTTPTTNGKDAFDQWFRDTPGGVNMPVAFGISLMDAGNGNFVYDNGDFFPIDGNAFGNQGRNHNFHFTYEIRTQFEYRGGEVFTFRGDDDLFTYVNGTLAINLGGVHGAQTATIDLDMRAAELGITPGNTYPLDFFFAERHTSESNFRIETTIGCFTPPVPR